MKNRLNNLTLDSVKPFRFSLNFNCKISNLVGFAIFLFPIILSYGQEAEQKPIKTGLGDRLNFSLNEDQYQFKISGLLIDGF